MRPCEPARADYACNTLAIVPARMLCVPLSDPHLYPNDAGLSVVDNCFGLLLTQRLEEIVFIDHGPEPGPESLG